MEEEKKRVNMNVKIDTDLNEELKAVCKKLGLVKNTVVCTAIKLYLRKLERDKAHEVLNSDL